MKKIILFTGLAGALLAATGGFAADDATTNTDANAVAAPADANATPAADQVAAPSPDDQTPQPPPADLAPPPDAAPAPAAPVPTISTPAPAPTAPAITPPPIASNVPPGTKADQNLRMNFKNAPLEQVLVYLSDAAGFIISERGSIDTSAKVTILSAQPVSKDEAVKLLKQKLNENGYTALQDGRMLTIIRSGEARTSEVVVGQGDDYNLIPKTTDVRTQIVPVHTLNVIQLIKELDSLRPPDTTLQADEAANAIVITGAQTSIRHLMEVVKALDGINSGSATVRVYPLHYADATKLVTMIKDLFPNPDATGAGAGNRFGRFGRGGGGGGFPFGGFGGGPGGGGDTGGDSNGHTPTAKVQATADDQSNSLIVSAPDTLIETIDELVKSLDVTVADTTLVKIFYLKNADPNEMANLLTSLYPDDTSSTTTTGAVFRPFGGFGFGGGGGRGGNNTPAQSDRSKKMSHVGAVADPCTRSLVVTAGKDLMPDIETMVMDLDTRDDGKLKVHVIPLANAEPIDVMQVLQSMFPTSLSTGSSSQINSTTSNPLLNRQTTLLQQQNNTTTSTFGSGSTSGGSGRGF